MPPLPTPPLPTPPLPTPPSAKPPRLRRRALLGGSAGWALAGCGRPSSPTAVVPPGGCPGSRAYVSRLSWHAGVAVARQALVASRRLPELADLPKSPFVEFGWGDREYFTAADPTVWQALAAALQPSPAVLQLYAAPAAARRDPATDTVPLSLSDAGLERLITYLVGTLDRPPSGRARPIASAAGGAVRFYPAHGRFHLFNTCNTWVAAALDRAGLGVSPAGVITSGDLMRQLADGEGCLGADPNPARSSRPR